MKNELTSGLDYYHYYEDTQTVPKNPIIETGTSNSEFYKIWTTTGSTFAIEPQKCEVCEEELEIFPKKRICKACRKAIQAMRSMLVEEKSE